MSENIWLLSESYEAGNRWEEDEFSWRPDTSIGYFLSEQAAYDWVISTTREEQECYDRELADYTAEKQAWEEKNAAAKLLGFTNGDRHPSRPTGVRTRDVLEVAPA